MGNKARRIIWSNYDLSLEDWLEFLEEEYPEITDEYEQCELIEEMNNEYLEDEKMNLDIALPRKILAIIDIGRWNGRGKAYIELEENINQIFELIDPDCRFMEWYVDEDDNIKCRMSHHDGTHFITFRAWNEDIDEEKAEEIMENLQAINRSGSGHIDLNSCTKSLGEYVRNVYGW